MLRDRAWNLILLDHSRSFTAGTELLQKLNRVDESFWAKIEGLTLDELNSLARAHGSTKARSKLSSTAATK